MKRISVVVKCVNAQALRRQWGYRCGFIYRNALDVFADNAQFGTLDALTTVNNAQREAYGYQVQGMNAQAQGLLLSRLLNHR